MIVQSISLIGSKPVVYKNFNQKPTEHESLVNKSSKSLISVSAKDVLSQMPNVKFRGRYEMEDLSDYENYEGPMPSQIELEKYAISKQVNERISQEDYLSAIQGKIKLARICRRQGKEDDAYMLEESIRRLYKALPIYQHDDAKNIIKPYNYDMAQYIDDDVARM